MKLKRAVSMVEIVVAIFVAALAIGPMIMLLSSSNRMSSTSTYETLAVYYANELCDQIKRLSPQLPTIINDARAATGLSSVNTATLFNSWPANVLEFTDNVRSIPFVCAGMPLEARIVLTPLHTNFVKRQITVEPLDVSANSELNQGSYWKAIVTVAWEDEMAPGDSARGFVLNVPVPEEP